MPDVTGKALSILTQRRNSKELRKLKQKKWQNQRGGEFDIPPSPLPPLSIFQVATLLKVARVPPEEHQLGMPETFSTSPPLLANTLTKHNPSLHDPFLDILF